MVKKNSKKASRHKGRTGGNNAPEPDTINYELPADSPVGEFEYKIASLAWEKGLAENSILDELGWKRSSKNYMKVRRALQKAVSQKLLVLNPPRNRVLEKKLVKAFPNLEADHIHVEVDRAAACLAAARIIAAEIRKFLDDPNRKEMVIANAGGRTVRDTISCLQRIVPVPPEIKDKKLIFLSLNDAEIHDQFDQGANFISVRLAQIYGARNTQHFAVVTPFDEKTRAEYLAKVKVIDLLITSAGSREGFLSHWLKRWGKKLSADAIGDVAFHLINSEGKGIRSEEEIQSFFESKLERAPDWEGLMQLFNKRKVLLILAGEKHGIARALLSSALPRRCVFDSSLALSLLKQ